MPDFDVPEAVEWLLQRVWLHWDDPIDRLRHQVGGVHGGAGITVRTWPDVQISRVMIEPFLFKRTSSVDQTAAQWFRVVL